MLGKLINMLVNMAVTKRVKKELQDMGVSVSVGNIKIVVPIEVESGFSDVLLKQAKKKTNEIIDKKIEPMFKNQINFEVDIQKKEN